jgi:hypothetical protein
MKQTAVSRGIKGVASGGSAGELPSPDAEQQAHSEALQAHIREVMMADGGRISFTRFMELALYAPGLGYYRCWRVLAVTSSNLAPGAG